MSNGNWWASKLGGGQQQSQPQQPSYPTTMPQQTYPATTPQPPLPPAGTEGHRLPASAVNASRCPECTSGKGIVGGPQASGPATPAFQVPTGGFNPTTIVGRIE
jgi:hypothetical protein